MSRQNHGKGKQGKQGFLNEGRVMNKTANKVKEAFRFLRVQFGNLKMRTMKLSLLLLIFKENIMMLMMMVTRTRTMVIMLMLMETTMISENDDSVELDEVMKAT